MRRLLASVVCGSLVFLAVGCTSSDTVKMQAPLSDTPVELKVVTAAKLDEGIAELKGKIVVADCWFLGCAPCVAKFPEFVAMHQELSAEGIAFISIDVIPDEADKKDKVLAFLKKQNAGFPNYLLKDTEEVANMWLERHGVVATPCTLIFNRNGELIKKFEDPKTERVKKFVREEAAK